MYQMEIWFGQLTRPQVVVNAKINGIQTLKIA